MAVNNRGFNQLMKSVADTAKTAQMRSERTWSVVTVSACWMTLLSPMRRFTSLPVLSRMKNERLR